MTFPINSIFLHFFDPHYLEEIGESTEARSYMLAESALAMRLALLCADRVLLPGASYVENAECRKMVQRYSSIFPTGALRIVGGERSLTAYADSKLVQYEEGSTRHTEYLAVVEGGLVAPGFLGRVRSTTADLVDHWTEERERFPYRLADLPLAHQIDELSDRWATVPAVLEHRGFTPEYVLPIVLGKSMRESPAMRTVGQRISAVINDGYFRSFLAEFSAGVITDLVYLEGFRPPPDVVSLPYGRLRQALLEAGLLSKVVAASPEQLRSLHDDPDIARCILVALQAVNVPHQPIQLLLPISDARPSIDVLLETPTGRKSAHVYADRIKLVFETVFRYSLESGTKELEINEGRKRIDLTFPNIASVGAFSWAVSQYRSRLLIVECKNYKDDPSNPELDQLSGRLNDTRGRFGILTCRSIKNFPRAIARCRDIHRDDGKLLVPLTDRDFAELADYNRDPGLAPLSSTLLGKRMLEVVAG